MVKEFHINRFYRDKFAIKKEIFYKTGRVIFANLHECEALFKGVNLMGVKNVFTEDIFAMALLQEINHILIEDYEKKYLKSKSAFLLPAKCFCKAAGKKELLNILLAFNQDFPPKEVYFDKVEVKDYLKKDGILPSIEELFLLHIQNINPAYTSRVPFLFSDSSLKEHTKYKRFIKMIKDFFKNKKDDGKNLFKILFEPILIYPNSLEDQIKFLLEKHKDVLDCIKVKAILSISKLKDLRIYFENINARFSKNESEVINRAQLVFERELEDREYEGYTHDKQWMKNVTLLAKNVLVYLYQLSKKYKKEIKTLNDIPQEELIEIREMGFNSLWFIGIWQRSLASKTIKRLKGMGDDKEASAYSISSYNISSDLGGWEDFYKLKERGSSIGLQIACDMVPNHTSIDSDLVFNHPDYFIYTRELPFSTYTFNSQNLSQKDDVKIFLEDHYYDGSDAAVVFKRESEGDTRYIYHGNDGTSTPWNDTAQINFLNLEAKEAIINQILNIAKIFKVIRLDAAMVLRRMHIQRLWFPNLNQLDKCIPSRERYGFMSTSDFEDKMPKEFWREVVDRVNKEAPDTLLLAEAFWLSEDYFVRTLGMHRVYNSAFMVMLSKELNQKHRELLKKIMLYDREILKRYVNYLSNPDEETAIEQFGDSDKYFGSCTMLVTMPGLPMFAHGQIERLKEKYGMEYSRSYLDENPDIHFVNRHQKEIFPLLREREMFSNIDNFYLFDFCIQGAVNENVYAYFNSQNGRSSLVLFNNSYYRTEGFINYSLPYYIPSKKSEFNIKIGDALSLNYEDNKFLILKDFKRNVYYIRTSKEVLDNGLYFKLEGYEAAVFWEFKEVFDGDGIYNDICNFLKGKPCFDLEKEIKTRKYPEIYDAFNILFSKDFFERLSIVQCLPTLEPEDKKFFQDKICAISNTLKIEGLMPSDFVNGINRSLILKKEFYENLEKDSSLQLLFCKIFDDLDKTLPSILLFLLRKHELYSFAQESLANLNIKDIDFYKSTVIFSDCLTEATLLELLDDSDFKNLIGVNFYRGIFWIDGEKFRIAIAYIIFFSLLFKEDFDDTSFIKSSFDFVSSILKMLSESMYELEKFKSILQKKIKV